MIKGKNLPSVLRWLSNFFTFFVLVAFVITCCMMLFIRIFAADLGIDLTGENLATAAKITFLNVLLLSFIFSIIDSIRRKITVERPVKRITEAAEKITQGDFSVRIEPLSSFGTDSSFNRIIECFNQMAAELGSVETLRSDFIANVSHEMKTPLAVMGNYGAMLKKPGLSEESRMEYASAISEGSRRMADMMTNILKLNRLENQQIFPQSTDYDLGEQLCECLLRYEDIWERENIEIETHIHENVHIQADGELLSLVWSNLLSNAFKFTEPGGTVSISLCADDTWATVRISDTGCGMTPEVGEHIFDKFYQGDTSRATQGNGLGLALVKRVMDITKGEISVESTPGVGSTFTVKLRRN